MSPPQMMNGTCNPPVVLTAPTDPGPTSSENSLFCAETPETTSPRASPNANNLFVFIPLNCLLRFK